MKKQFKNVELRSKLFYVHFFLLIMFSSVVRSQNDILNESNKFKGYDVSLKHGIISNLNKGSIYDFTKEENESSSFLENNVSYDFHGKTGNSINIARAQCSDSLGNIYITGSSGNVSTNSGDITTIKVNSSGEIEWTLRIPSPEFTVNSGTAITIDPNGFLYLVGYLWNQTSMDVFCAKISNDGQLIWQNTYGNSSNFDIPNSLVLSNSGELYVSGITHSNSKVTYYISKISSQGQLLWEHVDATFPVQTWNEPKILRLDNLGNLLVCGFGYEDNEEGFVSKTVTIKFNSDGVQLWKKFKTSQTTIDNNVYFVDSWPADFTIDTNNSIYVLNNYTDEIITYSSTFNYDSNGHDLWLLDLNFNNQFGNRLKSILFHENKLFVGGNKVGDLEAGDGIILHSLNLDGSINWSQYSSNQYNPSDFFMSIISNTICLNTIHTENDLVNESFRSIINSSTYSVADGSLQSSNDLFLWQFSQGITVGKFLGVAFNSTNKSLIFNSSYAALGTVYEVFKFDINNSLDWNTKFVSDNSIRVNVLQTVADSNSNTYSLVSSFYASDDISEYLGQKTYLIKYNSVGHFVSSYLISDTDFILSSSQLSINNNNELVVFLKDANSVATLAKFTVNLEQVWSENFSLLSIAGTREMIVQDDLSNIYLIASLDIQDNIVVQVKKFNSSGILEFSNLYTPTNPLTNFSIVATSSLFDDANSIFIGGILENNLSLIRPFVLNISTNGTLNYFNDYQLIDDFSTIDLKLNFKDNEIYLAADGINIQTFQSGYCVLKVNNQGELLWQLSNFVDGSDLFMQEFLLSSNLNKLYIISSKLPVGALSNIQIDSYDFLGSFLSSYDIEPNNYYQDAFLDNNNIYVLSLNESSYHFPFRLLNWGGPFISSSVNKIHLDLTSSEEYNFYGSNFTMFEPKQFIPLSNSNLLISGRLFHEELFYEGIKFFSIPYQPILNIPEVVPAREKNFIFCYPNPASTGITNIYFSIESNEDLKLSIYDLNGRLIKSFIPNDFQLENKVLTFNNEFLESGIYVLNLSSKTKSLSTKLIIE